MSHSLIETELGGCQQGYYYYLKLVVKDITYKTKIVKQFTYKFIKMFVAE